MFKKLAKIQKSFTKALNDAEILKAKLQEERLKVSDQMLTLEDKHNKLTQEVSKADRFIEKLTDIIGG